MTVRVIDLLSKTVKDSPPRSQREACALTVRQSIAALGACVDADIPQTADDLARGLFGEAFEAASEQQRQRWSGLMEDEYRKAIAHGECALCDIRTKPPVCLVPGCPIDALT